MLPDVAVQLTGSRFRAGYRVSCRPAEAAALAEALAVEQTLEFPAELLADGDIRRRVKGQVEKVDPVGENLFAVEISYADEVSGFELPQLLNVLFGNVSLLPGIRLERIDLTAALLAHFRGPRFGRAGLRRLVHAEARPLLATALKPMGLPPAELARLAGQFALGGIDLIKDDHGLANQPFAPWRERVAACAEAVRDANAHSDGASLYLPSASGPIARCHSSTIATITPISGNGTPIRLASLWRKVIGDQYYAQSGGESWHAAPASEAELVAYERA
jgi:ribulose-bisphosphate carboxylase large chain